MKWFTLVENRCRSRAWEPSEKAVAEIQARDGGGSVCSGSGEGGGKCWE